MNLTSLSPDKTSKSFNRFFPSRRSTYKSPIRQLTRTKCEFTHFWKVFFCTFSRSSATYKSQYQINLFSTKWNNYLSNLPLSTHSLSEKNVNIADRYSWQVITRMFFFFFFFGICLPYFSYYFSRNFCTQSMQIITYYNTLTQNTRLNSILHAPTKFN